MYKLLSKDHANAVGSIKKENDLFTTSEKETLELLASTHFPGSTEIFLNSRAEEMS